MLFSTLKETNGQGKIKGYLKSNTFFRAAALLLTLLFSFIIIYNGAMPKKYKISLGDTSKYDIAAPRDIENKVKTNQNRKDAKDAVPPVTKEISRASIEVINLADDFTNLVETARKDVEKSLQNQGITNKKDKNYKQILAVEQELASKKLHERIRNLGVPLSIEQVRYLVIKAGDEDIDKFKRVIKEQISNIMTEEITNENLAIKINQVQNNLQVKEINQDLKNIGELLVKGILKPNRTIDAELTKIEKDKAYAKVENVVKILKGQRIISQGDIVTEDKFEVLKELNLVETDSRFDFGFAAGVLVVLVLLAALLLIYMNHFCRHILYNRNDVILISVIIVLTLSLARMVFEYTPLLIPIFLAPMLISILLDLKLAGVVNFVLTLAISLMTRGDIRFLYMAMISGTIAAFLVSRATQRSKLSIAGIIVGVLNVAVISCIGAINKSEINIIFEEVRFAFINGILSIVLTLGTLPFWEMTFNIITPLKLLELANPNQPLIKRLLMEAPGTYHHSLMVGNLAEVATEAIGGNSLLARVGAYFHDVGKLKRPNFFKENQMADNPHDRMTANLSTLVITSHTQDGLELAEKYKIPLAIREIIRQHHGTTLVAYFYHKAKKGEKGESIKQENFRYEGPKPSTKEAAVVMLADSVEAAVRSMVDKTEGKIEGLVRKIIKDKLDDGQLDLCDLTLRDLDNVAKAFMRVLSGLFHEREEYPEVKVKQDTGEVIISEPVEGMMNNTENTEEVKIESGNLN
ncbi:MAG: HDIG domain-containing protein [Clostridia bacterium]|nr:HDIG domain-containing protein [Clostridia bacterium]